MTTAKNKKGKKERPKRGGEILLIHLDNVGVKPNFNLRIDYGDIDELARSIKENGVRTALKGHYDKIEDKYLITSGHRRLKALQKLAKEGYEIPVPILSDASDSDENRILSMITDNSGKRFNPVEEAEVISRLVSQFDYSDDQIRIKTGFTKVYVCNLKLLSKAPKKLKDLIINNTVSATLAMKVLREEKDYEKAQEIIEKTIVSKVNEGGGKKITEKDLNKEKGKQNSYSNLRKAFKKYGKHQLTPRQDKIELFEFVQRLNNGEMSLDTVIAELFEPVADDKEVVDKNQTNLLDEIETNSNGSKTEVTEEAENTEEN